MARRIRVTGIKNGKPTFLVEDNKRKGLSDEIWNFLFAVIISLIMGFSAGHIVANKQNQEFANEYPIIFCIKNLDYTINIDNYVNKLGANGTSMRMYVMKRCAETYIDLNATQDWFND